MENNEKTEITVFILLVFQAFAMFLMLSVKYVAT